MALTRPKYSQIFDSDFKNSCRVATTTSVTLTGAAPNVVDGVTLELYDRVLVKAQDLASQNGIYFVTVLGTGSNGTWTRALDANDGTRLTSGTTLSVEEGETFGGKLFRMTSPNPINLGVSDISWVDVSGGGGAASGNNGQVQYNDNNAPAGATYLFYNKASGQLKANATTSSTSTTTGAFIVTGGVGISGNVNAGGHLSLAGNATVGNIIAFSGGVGSGISATYETVSGGIGYSYYFDGGSGIRYPTTSNLEFGSDDFTIEFWMNAGSSQTPYATITDSSTNNQATYVGIGMNNGGTSGKLSFQAAGSSGTINSSTSVLDNTWHHIACVKSGSNGYVFIDGQLDGSTSGWGGVTNAYLSAGTLGRSNYGGGGGGDNTYAGYLSNFRIVKGVALYTSNFTVPTVPLSSVANTQLLTLQNATLIDNSTNAFTLDSAGSTPTAGTTPTLEASGESSTTGTASLLLNSDGSWESSTDVVVDGAIYTDNYKFANGASFISTSIANTSDIVANISSGIVGVSLTATGVSAGTYGNTTSIPTVVVDSKGRVTSVTNNAVSTKINLSSGATEEDGGNTTYSYYVTNGSAVAPSAAMATIGTSDFTVELFFQIGSYRYNGRIVGLGGYAQPGNFNIETAGAILIHINGSFSSYSASLDPGTWYHLAVSRTSGVVTVFLDGTSIGSYTQSGAINNSSDFYMGSNGGDYFDGYINNVRVVNGTGLYTANFSPPTTNLTAVSGTQLLTLQDATLIDNSTNGYSITTQGTAPVVSDSITPFSGGSGGTASTANVANGGTLTISGANGVTSSVTDATYTIGLGTLPGFVSSGVANIANTTTSTSTTSGALTVAGGVGIAGNINAGGLATIGGNLIVTGSTTVGGNVYITGNLEISGTQTTFNTNNVTIDDSIIYIADNNSGDVVDIGLVGHFINPGYQHAGFVRDASDGVWKLFSNVIPEPGTTIDFTNAIYAPLKTGAITSTGTVIASTLNAGTIGNTGATLTGTLSTASQTNITSVGTLTSLSVSGALSAGSFTVPTAAQPNITSVGTLTGLTVSGAIVPNANLTVNIGSTSAWFNTYYGVATQAKYADLAENYQADAQYVPGTVLVFGGAREVTTTDKDHNTAVAGIVSTNPAHLMNGMLTGEGVVALGLTGRLPCRVQGPVAKGDVLVTSTTPGVAQKIDNSKFLPGCVVGKALESINSNNIQTIEVVVGRF